MESNRKAKKKQKGQYKARISRDAGFLNADELEKVNNLGSAASLEAGSGPGNLVQLDSSGNLPASVTSNISVSTSNIQNGAVSGDKITTNAITNNKIADSTITGAKLASNTITSTQIASNAVTSSEIASNAVTSSEIANNAVTSSEIADGAVTSSEIANNAVGSSEIANGAVTDAKLASGVGTSAGNLVKLDSSGKLPAIDGSQLTGVAGADGSVDSAAIATDAVTSDKIADNAVTSSQLASNSVTNAKITNATITGSKLANDTITSTQIASNAVTSSEIANNAVGSSEISSDAVTSAKIANNAVGTSEISSSAVTTTKIADGAVNTSKIADGNVTTAKIADDAVTLNKLNGDIVDPSGGLEIGTNGLKLATSAAATKVQLNVNSTTGVAFVNGTTHQDRTSGFIVTDKFVNVTDAIAWMANNLASTSVRVDLIIETDTTETMDGQYWWRTNSTRYGNINIWGKPLYDQHPWTTPPSSAITNPTITVNVDQNTSKSSRFMVWAENVITIRGVNWTCNMGSKSNEFHALFRSLGNASRVTFSYNKVKATSNSGTRLSRGFDSVNGAMIRITSDLFTQHADRYDPLGNGGRAHGLELDLVGVPIVDNVFAVSNGASFELIEFRPDTTTDLSGLHFVGSGTANIGNVFYMQAGSRVETNSKVTRSSSTTMSGSSVVRAIGYNSVFFNAYSEDTDATPSGGTSAFPKLPANSGFHSSSISPNDYIIVHGFQASNTAAGPVATNTLDIEPNYL